eukprot:scpid78026/ scgid14821/ 
MAAQPVQLEDANAFVLDGGDSDASNLDSSDCPLSSDEEEDIDLALLGDELSEDETETAEAIEVEETAEEILEMQAVLERTMLTISNQLIVQVATSLQLQGVNLAAPHTLVALVVAVVLVLAVELAEVTRVVAEVAHEVVAQPYLSLRQQEPEVRQLDIGMIRTAPQLFQYSPRFVCQEATSLPSSSQHVR